MTGNKKNYKQPVYCIIQIRSKLSLLSGSTAGDEEKDPARQNDMEDTDDF